MSGMNCLFCGTPIDGLINIGSELKPELAQACDKACGHGLKMCQKIEGILNMYISPLVEAEAETKPETTKEPEFSFETEPEFSFEG